MVKVLNPHQDSSLVEWWLASSEGIAKEFRHGYGTLGVQTTWHMRKEQNRMMTRISD
jgi:hypothetical protein